MLKWKNYILARSGAVVAYPAPVFSPDDEMSSALACSRTRFQRDLIIEILDRGSGDDPNVFASLQREASVLAALAHPNVAATYGLELRKPIGYVPPAEYEAEYYAQAAVA